jgi:exopolysaccharide production protein ExoY
MIHSDFVDQSREVAKPIQDISSRPRARSSSPTEKAIKRVIDVVGALTFFVVFGPLYIAVALAIWLSGGGPIHYQQTRLGKDGKPFHVYKFRSMVANAEQVLEEFLAQDPVARVEWDAFQKLNNDPRIIPIGKFIRRFSLDELPQFWNVLRGDMSLIGPRPCMERQRNLYGSAWAHYTAVRPGLTGLWQVSGRNNLTFAQRVALDTEYVTCWSLVLDLKILLKTFRAVMVDGK